MIKNFVAKGGTVAAYLLYSASQKELKLINLLGDCTGRNACKQFE